MAKKYYYNIRAALDGIRGDLTGPSFDDQNIAKARENINKAIKVFDDLEDRPEFTEDDKNEINILLGNAGGAIVKALKQYNGNNAKLEGYAEAISDLETKITQLC